MIPSSDSTPPSAPVIKRGRGRPPGSKNKKTIGRESLPSVPPHAPLLPPELAPPPLDASVPPPPLVRSLVAMEDLSRPSPLDDIFSDSSSSIDTASISAKKTPSPAPPEPPMPSPAPPEPPMPSPAPPEPPMRSNFSTSPSFTVRRLLGMP